MKPFLAYVNWNGIADVSLKYVLFLFHIDMIKPNYIKHVSVKILIVPEIQATTQMFRNTLH